MGFVISVVVATRWRRIPLLLLLSSGFVQSLEPGLAPLAAPPTGAVVQPPSNEGYLLLLTVKPDPSLAYGGYVHDYLDAHSSVDAPGNITSTMSHILSPCANVFAPYADSGGA